MPPEPSPPLGGRRVLLADDIPAMRRLYASALTKAGAAVTAVSDGAEAVDAWAESVEERRGASGGPFDAVVLDYAMPRLDGGSVAAALRAGGFGGAIVGISAQVIDREVGPWLAAGCDVVLRKGRPLAELVARVGEACERRRRD